MDIPGDRREKQRLQASVVRASYMLGTVISQNKKLDCFCMFALPT
jgi:hypothetical protein